MMQLFRREEELGAGLDGCALGEEELAQFLGVKGAVVARVEVQVDAATGTQMPARVVQKELPFADFPRAVFGGAIERDRERGNPVVLRAGVGQRLEFFDLVNDAL